MDAFGKWYKAEKFSSRLCFVAWNAAIDAAVAQILSESYGHDTGDGADRMAEAVESLKHA
jgi:hypothetical protein